MEPDLHTDPELLGVLEELKEREPIFHRSKFGTTRGDFERMTEAGFWETGASGKRYSRAFVLDTLEQRHAHPAEDTWETRDFHCLEIAPDNYLLTYTLLQSLPRTRSGGERITRRATLWRHTADGWKIVYHQGTIVENQ
ncbi:MAG TPA: DUF4440 domain-containing protein [Xanthomonadaceae bacterium]|nr:DUF4440 domain-containing protein [Xanthomonadaceae bacterium]